MKEIFIGSFADGSMKICNAVQTRQRIKPEGEPPQRDGFEPDYRGARELDRCFHCPTDEPGVLRGQFSSEVGGNIYSKATGKWYRAAALKKVEELAPKYRTELLKQ